MIISGDNGSCIGIWDATTGALLKKLTGHTKKITSVCCSHGDNELISKIKKIDHDK